MKTEIDVKNYRVEKTLSLIEKYKSLIDDTFEIFDKNVSDEADNKEENEKQKLERIKKRSGALDQVQEFLSQIENLEHHLKESDDKGNNEKNVKKEEQGYQHPTKARAKN